MRGLVGETFVLGHLVALVPGQGLRQLAGRCATAPGAAGSEVLRQETPRGASTARPEDDAVRTTLTARENETARSASSAPAGKPPREFAQALAGLTRPTAGVGVVRTTRS